MAKILITTPDGRQATFELSSTPIKLGRAEHCDFVLRNDAEVSREHAQMWLDEQGRVVVADLGSKNGTRVDEGDLFKGARQFAQRAIRIGEHDIQVLGGRAGSDPARPPVIFVDSAQETLNDTQFFPSTRRLDISQQRLDLLIQLTERIGGVFERKQLLEQALDACCETLGFERGLIALKTQRGDTEHPVTRNVQRDESGAFRVSRTLINRALVDGERAIVNNPAELGASLSESLVRYPICSALCVPIMHRGEILGVIYGDRVTQASTYQPEDVDFLAAIAQQVGVGITNLRLVQEHLQAQRVYAELQQARAIQRRLLPARSLERGRVSLAGYNEPSSAVSGDYYDFFELSDSRIGIIIADVSGHGLPAALVMANLQAAVRVALPAEESLAELVVRVNRLICANVDSHVFVTALLGVVDATTGAIEYVSAGHPCPLLVRQGRVQEASDERNSLPLGIEPEETFNIQRIEPDGTRAILLYTDGVTEAVDRDGALLGLVPVVNAIGELRDHQPGAVMQAVRAAVRDHLDGVPATDDMTLLAIQIT